MKHVLAVCALLTIGAWSCISSGLFEKNVTFRDHSWTSSEKPVISFDIRDTTSSYNIFFVVRHTDAYHFNNLWVRVSSKGPGDSVASAQRFDLPLASQNKWTGTGMDDIFEHRILLSRQPVRFPKPGRYDFTLEHIMRENPLQEVMNVGIRLEKSARP